MFKKIIAASAFAAFAATGASADSETIPLSGSVDYQCAITLGAQVSGTVTVGSNTGEHGMGSLDIACNDGQGFTLSADSTNNFKLEGDGFSIPYTFRLTDPTGMDVTFTADGDSTTVNDFVDAYASGVDVAMFIDPDSENSSVPGGVTLTDDLTFTLDGNP